MAPPDTLTVPVFRKPPLAALIVPVVCVTVPELLKPAAAVVHVPVLVIPPALVASPFQMLLLVMAPTAVLVLLSRLPVQVPVLPIVPEAPFAAVPLKAPALATAPV